MKIIQLCSHFYPVIGGKETAVLQISEKLVKRGHEVIVFTSDLDRIGKRIKNKEEIYHGVKIKRFRSWFSVQNAVLFPGIIKDLLILDYDVILTHTYRQPQTDLSLICAKLRGKKCVLITTHNFQQREGVYKVIVDSYDSTIAYIFLRFYDIIVTPYLSEYSRSFFQNRGVKKERIKLLPYGIDDIFFKKIQIDAKHKFNIEGRVVINVGRLEKGKGQDLLINAIHFVKNKANYAFVGPDAGVKEKLEKKVKELGLNNVFFLGDIKNEELAALYNQSDVFVYSSRDCPYGIVVLEAMASGLPVVVSKFAGIEKFIKGNFVKVVDPLNPHELTEAIDHYLKEKYVSEKGIEEAKKFTWNRIVNELEKFIVEK